MNDLNYLEDLKIDENRLNEIVDKHAYVSMQYHELYSKSLQELNDQKRQVKIEKANLDEVFAKLYLQNKRSGEKITEKENESMIIINQEYKEQLKKYYDEMKKENDLDYSMNILQGVVSNMKQRKDMIEEKICLLLSGINSNIKQKNVDNVKNKILNKLNKEGE